MDILNKILIVFIVTIAFSDKKSFSAHKRSTTQTQKKKKIGCRFVGLRPQKVVECTVFKNTPLFILLYYTPGF
jgi:hypothetical protein